MIITLRPKREWLKSRNFDYLFPSIIYELKKWNKSELKNLISNTDYNSLRYDDRSPTVFAVQFKYFVLGGSWNLWADQPHYLVRCAFFEDLFFPYDYPFRHLLVRNAVLLWSYINTSLYTSRTDPNVVFLFDSETKPRIVAKFTFNKTDITLTEYE